MSKKKNKERSYTDSDAKKFEKITELIAKEATFADASQSMVALASKDATLRGDWSFTGMLATLHGRAYLEWLEDYQKSLHNVARVRAIRALSDLDQYKPREKIEAAIAITSGRSTPRFNIPNPNEIDGRHEPELAPPLKDGAALALGLDPIKDDSDKPDYLDDEESD